MERRTPNPVNHPIHLSRASLDAHADAQSSRGGIVYTADAWLILSPVSHPADDSSESDERSIIWSHHPARALARSSGYLYPLPRHCPAPAPASRLSRASRTQPQYVRNSRPRLLWAILGVGLPPTTAGSAASLLPSPATPNLRSYATLLRFRLTPHPRRRPGAVLRAVAVGAAADILRRLGLG
jgi:hypothetical protein